VYENTNMSDSMIYATAKGGITNLTRLMASYYGHFNIRVKTPFVMADWEGLPLPEKAAPRV
jgi:hypothetical protein